MEEQICGKVEVPRGRAGDSHVEGGVYSCRPDPVVWSVLGPVLDDPVLPDCLFQSKSSLLS